MPKNQKCGVVNTLFEDLLFTQMSEIMEDRHRKIGISQTLTWILLPILCLVISSNAHGQKAYEIWTPSINNTSSKSFGTCHFRKRFSLIEPAEAEFYWTAKDQYELYFNGNLIESGQSNGTPKRVDVKEYVQPGVNTIAIKVTHGASQTAGLAAKFRVREANEQRWRSLTTDDSWKVNSRVQGNWFGG
ncbi:MAG: hypothetical protein AAGA30_05445, partial [Planctomycetota bacterium]